MGRSLIVACALLAVISSATADVRAATGGGQATFTYSGSDGCGDLSLYSWNQERTEVLLVTVDRNALGLGVGTRTLELTESGVKVQVDLYTQRQDPLPYCTDVAIAGAERPTSWTAKSGRLTVTLTDRGTVQGRPPEAYRATVVLEDLELTKPDGTTVKMKDPVTLTGIVGWVAG